MIREGLKLRKQHFVMQKISKQGKDEIRVRNSLTQPVEVLSFSYGESDGMPMKLCLMKIN